MDVAKKKINPTGVRFNEDHLGLVLRLEKLKTKQEVVNFLLADYWWRHKHQMDAQKAVAAALPYVNQQQPKSIYETYEDEIRSAQNLAELNKMGKSLENERGLNSAQKATLNHMAKQRAKYLEF